MKRNTILISIILAVIIIFTGCKGNEEVNKKLIEKVKKVEENEFKLDNFKIDYFEYNNTRLECYSTSFIFDDNILVFGYKNKDYRIKDLVYMSLEELNKISNETDYSSKNTDRFKLTKVEISNLYNEKSSDSTSYKHVFVKRSYIMEGKEYYLFVRYSFIKEDKEWKIINNLLSRVATKDTENDSEYSAFTRYNNEKITYVETVDMLNIQ